MAAAESRPAMKSRNLIAIDAMGGDEGPGAAIAGASVAKERFPESNFMVFGDESVCRPLVAKYKQLSSDCDIIHTSEQITAEAKPSVALRRGRSSSMGMAIQAVAHGKADAVVSAGNTGALMAMSKVFLKTLPGISRPAIAGLIPTRRSESVFLDLGANVECSKRNLVEFACMGTILARAVLGVVRPTVGLLNVGQEEFKGKSDLQEVANLLRRYDQHFEFKGFVEGDDVATGTTDVVVTDGFTGNVALKVMEGVAQAYSDFLRRSLRSSLVSRVGAMLASSAFERLRLKVDPRRHNGAMFVGLNGVAVKSHGGTDSVGFANAVGVGIDIVKQGVNDRIISDLAEIDLAELE